MNLVYPFLLYLHIFSVILSVGPFFILLPLLKKLKVAGPGHEEAYLDTFRAAVRLAKHAGHVLVVTGVLLVWITKRSWTTSWLLTTIVILICSLYFLARAFSPTIRRFKDPEEQRAELTSKLKRTIWIYLALMLSMLWFMVAKPQLWT
ncbi:hypothetical protein QUF84_05080 [Fictibacillus enclensis]|uniref:hypothetical protein n=1 Tax=Fictibacillus enclensis TaxID=1017270 RepID=UPI0024C002B7|nr:hypothetical protein [Fictibacillus enclensis]MDM5336604.1 hypothetical protein [Fictibacillus enclensis]WHY73051.1 hypothetical protein QNH15_03705 [Fictibacillus enclensis]